MFETDRVPAEWVSRCNRMDEVWVPSRFHLETFQRSGVAAAKLVVIHQPLDTQLFAPQNTASTERHLCSCRSSSGSCARAGTSC